MPIGAALSLFCLLLLLGFLPIWPWSRGWSYRPALLVGVVFTFAVMIWVTILV
ncbi:MULTISPECIES: DUF3309 family protein [unclassified Aureimonas]|uniref:DUF3309 family protein n=1 Tax=unclassified Aureimonas TaxID=2615206 RepID=UPI00072248A1|nr:MULTISPECIES: DUF3309 family protein [unclassified Aureimonas]ALN72168.1 hypothetical protein M673_05535 [Aureimonas sp. AU20]